RIFALHRGDDDFDFLVSEFVENDGSPPDEHSFGGLLRKIHAARLPDFPLVMHGTAPLERTLAERISQRAAVVEKLTGLRFDLPAQNEIQTMLTWRGGQQVVLHMDARPANLL